MPITGKALLAAAASFIGVSTAYPQNAILEARYDGFSDTLSARIPAYQAPGPTDSRGPCPGLNTLANHGLINRNGKNIKSDDVKIAFAQGFGINENGFDQALHNWEVVCEYIKGATCGVPENNGTFILTNLTILGEPHAFEHDHSYSRQDYKQNYAHGAITNNIYFNASEMQTGLDIVGYTPSNPPKNALANYQQFNQIRLQRESLQNQQDFPGWFQQNIPPTLFETGFIFGATFDRDSSGNMKGTTPMVRLDWWNFWFAEESFPTQLGWVPAHTSFFEINFITSVSSAVLGASITSTPKSLPAGATAKTASPPNNLPEADPSPTVPLFGGTAYVAPTQPASIHQKRAAEAEPVALILPTLTLPGLPISVISEVASLISKAPQLIAEATSAIGPAPSKYDPYKQSLNVDSLRNQIASAESYEKAILDAVTSLAGAIL